MLPAIIKCNRVQKSQKLQNFAENYNIKPDEMSWFTPKSNAALLKLANKCNGFADPEVHGDD